MCVIKLHAFIYFLRPPPWSGTLLIWNFITYNLYSIITSCNNQGCGAGTGTGTGTGRNRIHLGTSEPEPELYSEFGSGSGSEYKEMNLTTQKNKLKFNDFFFM